MDSCGIGIRRNERRHGWELSRDLYSHEMTKGLPEKLRKKLMHGTLVTCAGAQHMSLQTDKKAKYQMPRGKRVSYVLCDPRHSYATVLFKKV